MAFVTVSGQPTRQETEDITRLWQSMLFNAHLAEMQRFPVDDNRVIMMFDDGARAWDAKDFLVKQERCADVTIEGRSYPGKGAPPPGPDDLPPRPSEASEESSEEAAEQPAEEDEDVEVEPDETTKEEL